jgi:type I restriction-modification system DNA methylase subunit
MSDHELICCVLCCCIIYLEIEKRLWRAADELRANSRLKSSEYSVPVLGLIFLRYADFKFAQAKKTLQAEQGGIPLLGRPTAKRGSDTRAQPDLNFSEKIKKGTNQVRISKFELRHKTGLG